MGCGAPPPGGGDGNGNGGGIIISGFVLDATNTTVGIGGSYVYVPHRPPASLTADARQADQVISSDTSEHDGSYALAGVPTGEMQIIVEPPEGVGYTGVQLDITVSGTANIRLDIKLVPSDVADQITAVVVSPSSATVTSGNTQQFTATILGEGGAVLENVSPTWTVTGNIGTVDANGLFTAGQEESTGFVIASAGNRADAAQVSVMSVPPGVVITVTLTAVGASQFAPLEVSFTGSATTTRPDRPITQYVLSFGDGSSDYSSTTPPSNVVHIYSAPGTFTATLTATDSEGAVGSDRVTIVVQPVAVGEAGLIAFTSDRDGNEEIYVMNADGMGQTRLTNNPALDAVPAWSPDGTKIAFTSERDGNYEVYVMDADGTGQTRLTNNPAGDGFPAWRPVP